MLDLVLTQTQVAVLLRKVSKDVELQEDRNVFAQLMMVSKSLPEIDIREAIGQHEFSVIPRSLFANDGTVSLLNEKRTHEYSGEDWRIT